MDVGVASPVDMHYCQNRDPTVCGVSSATLTIHCVQMRPSLLSICSSLSNAQANINASSMKSLQKTSRTTFRQILPNGRLRTVSCLSTSNPMQSSKQSLWFAWQPWLRKRGSMRCIQNLCPSFGGAAGQLFHILSDAAAVAAGC